MFNKLLKAALLRLLKTQDSQPAVIKPFVPPVYLTERRLRGIVMDLTANAKESAKKIKQGTDEIVRVQQSIRKNYPARPKAVRPMTPHLRIVK